MEDAEREQRSYGDRFWGYDNEIHNRNKERFRMDSEDRRSRTQELHYATIKNQSRWEEEIKEEIYAESFVRSLEQVQERRRYLKAVFSNETSQHIIDYKWSTRQKIRPVCDPETSAGLTTKRLKHRTSGINNSPIARLAALEILPQQVQVASSSQGLGAERYLRVSENDSMSNDSTAAPSVNSTGSHEGNGSLSSLMRQHQETLADPSGEESVIRHVDIWDGHPEHKWDQEIMLKKAFYSLCQTSSADPESSSTAHVLCLPDLGHLGLLIARLPEVQKLLRYTVFGSWVKRKKWHLFTSNLEQRNDYPSDLSLSLVAWLDIARNHASKEVAVERRQLRSDQEHRNSITHSCNKWCERLERISTLARTIVVGSMVWALHGRGMTWLPAVVQAIHVSYAAVGDDSKGEGDCFTYDLTYLITQQAFAVAADLQNSSYQVTKLSAMALLADQQANVPQSNLTNQNQWEDDDQQCKRALNVSKSRCNNSAYPEKTLSGYVYDSYFYKGDRAAENTDFSDGDDSFKASAHVEFLFDGIRESQLTHSSEALSSVCGRVRSTPLQPSLLHGHIHSSTPLSANIWSDFLIDFQTHRDRGSQSGEKESILSPSFRNRPGTGKLLERKEWMETCYASMDICRYNAY